MKKSMVLSIVVLVILGLFLAGCNSTPGKSSGPDKASSTVVKTENPADVSVQVKPKEDTPVKETPLSGKTLSMSDLYRYASVKNFSYNVLTRYKDYTSSLDFSYSLSEESVDSTPSWLLSSTTSTNGVFLITNTWVDKNTYSCLKVRTVIDNKGSRTENVSACPQEGPYAKTSASATPILDYIGNENVVLSKSTYDAEKYRLGNTTYYYSKYVPLPLKVVYQSGDSRTDMTLIEYS